MSRWIGFLIFAIVGLALFWCGLLMPVHLRAVDGVVLRKAGDNTPSLVDKGATLAASNQLGGAQLFLAAALSALITNSHSLSDAIGNLNTRQFSAKKSARFGDLLQPNPKEPFAEFIVLSEHRNKALEILR